MDTIKNVKPISAEELFGLLKKEFSAYVDMKMDSSLNATYAHVHDVINITFPEVVTGVAFTVIVSDEEIAIKKNGESVDYDLELLGGHLTDFLKERCE